MLNGCGDFDAIYAAYLPTADRDAAMTVGTGLDDAILAHRLRTGERLRTVCAPDERLLTPLDDMSDVMKLNEIAHNDTNNSHALEATPGIEIHENRHSISRLASICHFITRVQRPTSR